MTISPKLKAIIDDVTKPILEEIPALSEDERKNLWEILKDDPLFRDHPFKKDIPEADLNRDGIA